MGQMTSQSAIKQLATNLSRPERLSNL